jgi:hypothetical protein
MTGLERGGTVLQRILPAPPVYRGRSAISTAYRPNSRMNPRRRILPAIWRETSVNPVNFGPDCGASRSPIRPISPTGS